MDSAPLVSVGLFVYNGERFIENALNSILNQTFTDFELSISDNASTDRTGEIAEAYARRDSRIRYYRSAKNMGAGWNARRVHELATGKYFKQAAVDDLLEPDFLRQCIEALEGNPKYVLAHSKTKIIDGNGNFVEYFTRPMETDSADAVRRFHEMLLKDHKCFQVFGVMRMSALRQIPPQGIYPNADGVLLARLALLGQFYEAPDYLFISRRHSGQSSRTLPVRLKQHGFRLTNRHGWLPSPEWWDPAKARAISFPELRQLQEFFLSIYRAPLNSGQRIRCYFMLLHWVKIHFRWMVKDLLIAADQMLYNLQVPKVTSTSFENKAALNKGEQP